MRYGYSNLKSDGAARIKRQQDKLRAKRQPIPQRPTVEQVIETTTSPVRLPLAQEKQP